MALHLYGLCTPCTILSLMEKLAALTLAEALLGT